MRVDGSELAAIFAGGFIGAIARTELGELLPYEAGEWPWATFLVNIAGALLLGYVVTRVQDGRPLFERSGPLLGTGFCGALTTFSAMQIELLRMLDDGQVALGGAYLAASVAAGLGAVALATRLTQRAGSDRAAMR